MLCEKYWNNHCEIYFSPTPSVTWRRVGASLPFHRHIVDLDGTRLQLQDIEDGDEGEYQCHATNSVGLSEITFQVAVQCKLILMVVLETQKFMTWASLLQIHFCVKAK